ncbi:hypothetical protein [Erythrobacter sp. Alg231-14]|uniref:hypothetical protein n=1 Tax=Erythrobacter sp. Alg231-14 TaxID=1922225 RepID=UPI000D55BB9C
MNPAQFLVPVLAAALACPVSAQDSGAADETQNETANAGDASDFVGRYNGNSFETAMGMIIREDGTFAWGVSVGALDMRAEGTWHQDGAIITLVSDPVPVAPEFGWSGFEKTPDGPLIKVVWATNGNPFQHASVKLTCRNGGGFFGHVPAEGWSPPAGECDEPVDVQLTQSIYDVTSQIYDIAGPFNPGNGGTVLFEFNPNDMGVADFTGVVGVLEDGILKLSGAEWPLELRKMQLRSEFEEQP